MDTIRIGRISAINYENAMVQVTYADRNDSVTDECPYLSMNGEYKMPIIGALVLVLHLSNNSAMAVVMGTYWSQTNKPIESGVGLFRKELSNTADKAYIRYEDSDGRTTIKAPHITFVDSEGGITLESIRQVLEDVKMLQKETGD